MRLVLAENPERLRPPFRLSVRGRLREVTRCDRVNGRQAEAKKSGRCATLWPCSRARVMRGAATSASRFKRAATGRSTSYSCHPRPLTSSSLGRSRCFRGRCSSGLGLSHVIHFDKRGTGMSDRVSGVRDARDADGRPTSRDGCSWVTTSCDHRLVRRRRHGCAFAATHPDRVWVLVLTAGRREACAPDYPWGPNPAASGDLRVERALREQDKSVISRRELAGSPDASEERYKRWQPISVMPSSPGAEEAFGRLMNLIDVREALAAIRTTLVLHRVEDGWVDVERGRDLARGIPGATFVELPGKGHIPSVEEIGPILDETEVSSVAPGKQAGGTRAGPDYLATVLFTDIVGATAKAAQLGDSRWRELLEQHHALVRRQLARFRGTEIDTAGDGFFSFDGPARAIRCACAIAAAVKELGLDVRAGLHTGECELVGGKIGGIAVHIEARVAAEAEPGEVLVSSTVKDLVAGSGIEFRERGVADLGRPASGCSLPSTGRRRRSSLFAIASVLCKARPGHRRAPQRLTLRH